MNFQDKVAVITGGASGIGLAIAKALAREGARIVLADVEAEALPAAEEELLAQGAEILPVQVDVGDRDAMFRLADATWNRFGAAHIVVHNAGVGVFGSIHELSHNDWLWSMSVNLWGPIHGVQAFLPRMVAQGGPGHHLFTASLAGLVPNFDMAPYNVSKAGVVALAESLRKELRPKGISASVLCPMAVATNMIDSARNRPDEFGGPQANEEEPFARQGIMGRTLEAESVAQLVLEAIREDRLYVHTHQEARPLVERRAGRMIAAFDHAL